MAGALILDVGGVLIETPTREARAAWERGHGLEDGALDTILAEAIGPGWEGGRSEAEIEARLCAACGIEASGLADLLEALAADERVCPHWRRALDDLAGTTALALLTNSGPKTRTGLVARHGLERWFPVIVISAEEGMSKPDPRIYRRTCERLGRSPGECLFVDDRASNVEGAEAAGLSAIRFESSRATIPVVLERLGMNSGQPAEGLDEPVEIAAWNPGWPILARRLIAELAGRLGAEHRIEHIGSTALEGMPAKPIIDLMVGVTDEAEQDACARRLSTGRWQDMGEAGVPGRRHLRRRSGEHANVHIVLAGSPHWSNNLAIRDYLRADPGERAAYAALKRSLSAAGVSRLLAYSDRKAAFMAALLDRARAWRNSPQAGVL